MQITSVNTDPLLPQSVVADMLGVKENTLEVWRCTKRYPLAYIKVGRLVRYRQSAVEAFLSARSCKA